MGGNSAIYTHIHKREKDRKEVYVKKKKTVGKSEGKRDDCIDGVPEKMTKGVYRGRMMYRLKRGAKE